MQLERRARGLWEHGDGVAGLLLAASHPEGMLLCSALAQQLAASASTGAAASLESVHGWADRAAEVHAAMHARPEAAAALLKLLLSPDGDWPRHYAADPTSPPAAAPRGSPGTATTESVSEERRRAGAAAAERNEMAVALAGHLGCAAVFGGGEGDGRPWLLLELLRSVRAAPAADSDAGSSGGRSLLDSEAAHHLVQGCLADDALPQQDAFLDDLLSRCLPQRLLPPSRPDLSRQETTQSASACTSLPDCKPAPRLSTRYVCMRCIASASPHGACLPQGLGCLHGRWRHERAGRRKPRRRAAGAVADAVAGAAGGGGAALGGAVRCRTGRPVPSDGCAASRPCCGGAAGGPAPQGRSRSCCLPQVGSPGV